MSLSSPTLSVDPPPMTDSVPPDFSDSSASDAMIPAIRVEGVSKRYHLWKSPSARLNYSLLGRLHRVFGAVLERDTPALAALAQKRDALSKDFFALQDITFTVAKGESVALIGRNGSGKSTLLQIIVNTLRPTTGEVDVEGRIAAMLELGSGFNPEFTGRENAKLNAMILGLEQAEVEARMEGIIEFADLGVFIDQPVKNYSSGMVVRLGFAVLTQIDPEILIIDEALAVGDFLFQQKCFDTIRRFRESGCTLLFVSHAMSTVMELCDRAILLDSGRVAFDGPAKDAVNLYEASALRSRFQTGERPLQILGAPPVRTSTPVTMASNAVAAPVPVVESALPAAVQTKGLSKAQLKKARRAALQAVSSTTPRPGNAPVAAAPAVASAPEPKPSAAVAAKRIFSKGPPPPPPSTWQRMSAPVPGRLVPVLPDHGSLTDKFTSEKIRRLEHSPAVSGGGGDSPTEADLGSLTSTDAALKFVRIFGQDGTERDWLTSEEEMTLDIGILCNRALHDPHVGFKVRDRLGRAIFDTSTLCMRESPGPVEAGEVLVTRFRFFLPILLGEYSITVGFTNGGVGDDDYAEALLYLHGARTFHVYRNAASIIWSGVCNLFPEVSFSREDRALYVMEPLPEAQAALLDWRLVDGPATVVMGKDFNVTVELANRSGLPVHSGDPNPVNLAYRWLDAATGEIVVAEGVRSPFPDVLLPGAHATCPARIVAPDKAGNYLLEITLVQEEVRWFHHLRPELLKGHAVKTVGD